MCLFSPLLRSTQKLTSLVSNAMVFSIQAISSMQSSNLRTSSPYQQKRLQKMRIESRMVRLRLIATTMVWCVACLMQMTSSYQLSMVASRAPFTDRRISSPSSSRSNSWGIPPPSPMVVLPGTDQLSSTLISSLAEVALKVRLADQLAVKVDVTANPTDLIFQGKVGPVTVQGRGWKSKLGLTCRALEASVDSCLLDVGRILSHRKLRLITPGTIC